MPDESDLTRKAWDTQIRILERMRTCRSDPERARPVAYTQGTADAVRQAITDILAEMTALAIVEDQKRQALEERITALEGKARTPKSKAAKP